MTLKHLRSGVATLCGEQGSPVVLLTGPPVGAPLFRLVQARMAPMTSAALELAVPAVPDGQVLEGLRDGLVDCMDELGADVVFAHGAAVPVALALPAGRARVLVVSNGPIEAAGLLPRLLASTPEPALAKVALRPAVFARAAASSLGLRRLVTNPYAMERDIVVMLCAPWLDSAERRHQAARWIRATKGPFPERHLENSRVIAFWGDHDPIHPASAVEVLKREAADFTLVRVPGGRMFHVEERPWALADLLTDLDAPPTTT